MDLYQKSVLLLLANTQKLSKRLIRISCSVSFGIAKAVVIQQKQFSAIELKNLVYCNKPENILSENRKNESIHSDIIVI